MEKDRLAGEPSGDVPARGSVVDGKYRIERVIGEGGMGVVLAAHHLLLDQRVAVKMMRSSAASQADSVPRLLREARASARLRSEHVVRVMDVGVSDGLPFIVMEYLEGQDLQSILASHGPLPVADVCDYALQALVALGEAHANGILHRDLKPSNLFLTKRPDGPPIVKILDFGVAKSMALTAETARLTSSGAIMGSPVYMSPEQVRGTRDIDARSDIWSIGVVLYELLTGALPFSGDTVGGVFAAILESPYSAMRILRPEIPDGLDAIVARCLARRREDRFANVAELARAVSTLARAASRDSLVERVEKALAQAPASVKSLASEHPPPGPIADPLAATRAAPLPAPPAPPPVGARTGQEAVVTSTTGRMEVSRRSRLPAIAGVTLGVLAGGLVVVAVTRSSPHDVADGLGPSPSPGASVAATTAATPAPAAPSSATPSETEAGTPNPTSAGRPPKTASPQGARPLPRKAPPASTIEAPPEIVHGARQ